MTPKTQAPRFFKKKWCTFVSIFYITEYVLWSRNVHRQPPERSDIFIFIFSGLWLSCWSWNSKKLIRLKIATDTLITFAGDFFYLRNITAVITHTRPPTIFFPFQKLRFGERQSNVSMTITASGVSRTTISMSILRVSELLFHLYLTRR